MPSPFGIGPLDLFASYRTHFAAWSRQKPRPMIWRDEPLAIGARLRAVANGWSGAREERVGDVDH
jgi:hypothetical protein